MRPIGFRARAGGAGGASYIAGGTVASAGTMPVSTSGAAVGDLIVVVSPFGAMTLSGTGWTSTTYSWYAGAGGYTGNIQYKALSATTDITCSGDGYGHMYAIYRGVSTVTVNGGQDDTTGTTSTVTWAAPGGSAKAQVMLMHQQTPVDPAAPSGFVDRYGVQQSGVFMMDAMDRLSGLASGGVVITNFNSLSRYIHSLVLS